MHDSAFTGRSTPVTLLDTLPSHYRHIGHLHEECDAENLIFNKMAAL